ncbi:hypothetical protein BGW36DRAFT_305552 [Talaromyces proteolyticus]|uniref:NAD(P)-binding protein n=1 Tax=Talaromyces proteolyticus TaxID=1131652 RepID=A0AAD4KH51_9EURO|nr:uncharacterized protein BGW36DRAFT_305552 [Talaromyces proteolyticus]KAH8691631.1 hypothetical protein BGW36DRAFT_305552 [Talaromyces proteolyticus]
MSSRLILITGANRGIGFATLQALSLKSPTDNFILACRQKEKGFEAVEQLRDFGIQSEIDVLEVDVTCDYSLISLAEKVKTKYGKLDVLINNAGVGLFHDSFSEMRSTYNRTLDTNVTSVAMTIEVLSPLLRRSSRGQIINVSSARSSLELSSSGKLPPTKAIAYSLSKTALNMLTVEYAKIPENKDLIIQTVSPGHCKTAFNNYRGTKDPLDGAKVIVALLHSDTSMFGNGFWQMEEGEDVPVKIPW